MINIAVLASGNGSNFQALAEDKELEGQIKLLLVNKAEAYAIERAKALKIDYVIIENQNYKNREQYDDALIAVLEEFNIDLVLLAGFMRMLSPKIVDHFTNRIINIHPSILPKYPGVSAIKQAYDAKETETGVTIHYVDKGLDSGQIILQEKIKIDKSDTLESLTNAIHKLEHKLYLQAVKIVLEKFK